MGEKGKHPWTYDREETKHNLSKILLKNSISTIAEFLVINGSIFIPHVYGFFGPEYFKNILERGINQECILQIQDSGNVL